MYVIQVKKKRQWKVTISYAGSVSSESSLILSFCIILGFGVEGVVAMVFGVLIVVRYPQYAL